MSEPFWTPLGGQPVDYKGDWAAGTQYVPGDVARYQGVDYLAVNPSLGTLPPLAQAPGVALVTALPGSPSDGQEVILVDAIGTATYAWRLRYVQARATNKWIFVGGSPAYSEVAAPESTTSTTYTNLGTVGPSIVIPVAGDYLVEHGYTGRPPATASELFMSYDIGATAAVDADAAAAYLGTTNTPGTSISRAKKKTGLPAVTLTAKYRAESGTKEFRDRWMLLTPFAVGG